MRRENGVTLRELLVAISLAAVFAAVAIPAWRSVAMRGRAAAEMNRLAGDLAYARSAAISRGRLVALCTSRDSSGCSSASWDDGWIVYADTNRNRDHDVGEPVLREEDAFANSDHLTGNRLVAHRFEFQKDGLPRGLHNGTITYTPVPDRQAPHRCVVIARTGRVRAEGGNDCR